MKRRYPVDPYWITAKFPSTCACKNPIYKGDRIMYFPRTKQAECETCGLKTEALLQDERQV